LLCPACRLIFVDPREHLPLEQERTRYQLHQNSGADAGYVRFLEQVLQPLLPRLTPAMRGLDYGCGPHPVLVQLLRQRGLHCEGYDPLFADHPLQPPYDFILSTECFEHFRTPQRDIARICALLVPGGWLGIMTELWTSLDRFATWAYTRDRTHVVFYHLHTLHWIAARFGLELLWQDGCRVALFRRHPTTANGSAGSGC
jgi:SAM-dependent methyltransferase